MKRGITAGESRDAGGTNGSDVSRRCVRATRGGGKDSAEYRKIVQRSVLGPHGSMTNPRAYDSGAAHGQVHHEARTLAECAELQCLPMAPLEGLTKTAAHTLVGNAVPPPVAEWVCRTVIRADQAKAAE